MYPDTRDVTCTVTLASVCAREFRIIGDMPSDRHVKFDIRKADLGRAALDPWHPLIGANKSRSSNTLHDDPWTVAPIERIRLVGLLIRR